MSPSGWRDLDDPPATPRRHDARRLGIGAALTGIVLIAPGVALRLRSDPARTVSAAAPPSSTTSLAPEPSTSAATSVATSVATSTSSAPPATPSTSGVPTTTAAGTTTTATTAKVELLVVNAGATGGAASRATFRLAQLGYAVRDPASTADVQAATHVLFAPGFEELARRAADQLDISDPKIAALADQSFVPDSADTDVVIVLGSDSEL